MAADSKKTELEDLIVKIKMQQEVIAKQITISSIDIDLQLDYIRALYESYLILKQDVSSKEKIEKKSNLSECGTLPLFDDLDEVNETQIEEEIPVIKEDIEEQIIEEEKPEEQAVEEELPVTEEVSDSIEENEQEAFDEEEIDKTDKIDKEDKEDEPEAVKPEEEQTDSLASEEAKEDIIKEEVSIEVSEEAHEKDEKATANVLDNMGVFPEMEIELEMDLTAGESFVSVNEEPTKIDPQEIPIDMNETSSSEPRIENNSSIPEIDIDAIEFEEEDDIDNNDTIEKEEAPVTHIGMSGQPRYWGDELDIENPIPVKPTSIGEQYKSNKPSLNEIVSGFKPDESIGMKLQHGSVSDLMKSIDMNLKFLFVKNLFKGNGSAFTEEINKINSIGKLHEAIKYVEEIKDKYKWDDKSEAYTELYKLILRKYAK